MYILRRDNKYWRCGKFVIKENAQTFDLNKAKELQDKLKRMCVDVAIESI